jgi:hypothetical protein
MTPGQLCEPGLISAIGARAIRECRKGGRRFKSADGIFAGTLEPAGSPKFSGSTTVVKDARDPAQCGLTAVLHRSSRLLLK